MSTKGHPPEAAHELPRALGPVQLTVFGIGAIIGAGIFATIGTAAAGDAQRSGAGPALMLSFILTAVVCGFTALCYAEFASMIPVAGSAYTYAHASLGEVIAWIIGWDLIIEYAVGNIGVAISWANYFKTFVKGFGINIPDWLSMDYRTAAKVSGVYESAPHLFGYPIVLNLLAVAIVALLTVILVWGIRESAWFNGVMVGIKILVLVFFIVVGFCWVQPANWTPFAPNGWAGVSAGAAIVFFAYIGFDAVSTLAEETKNPQRNLPIGILSSLAVCTVFYVIVSAVFTGLIPYGALKDKLATEQAEPLTMALVYANPKATWAVGIVAFGSVVAHTAVLLVFQLGQPRIFMAMARDGLLPPLFARVHPRFQTPHVATILTGLFVAGFAAIASIDEMVDLTNIGTLFAFILVCAGIIVLRIKEPSRPRGFRVPGGWLWAGLLYAGPAAVVLLLPVPAIGQAITLIVIAVLFAAGRNHIIALLGIVCCLYLIYYLPPTSWLRFAAWLNCGFVIYVGYGAVHSRLTGRPLSTRSAAHDARTAYAGIWFALLGAALLFLTHGFDLWLRALQRHEGLAFLLKAQAALDDVLQRGPWLQMSGGVFDESFWFLIVPLAVNGFLLCPIIIRRALRARLEATGGQRTGTITASLIIAFGLATATIIYFVLIAAYNIYRSDEPS
jgi:APA family basic amino acid/polyamine antiporter